MARARLAPLLVATAGALYFGWTAARDLQPFDSTEFAFNAVQLGVGHPPGQPLYLLLSAAAVRVLRFLSPSHALAWLSIAATVGAAAWAVAAGVALAPRLVALLLAQGPRRGLVGGAVLVGSGLAGLLPYAVLPIIGAHPRDALVWGEPLRGDALTFFLSGRDYRAWHV